MVSSNLLPNSCDLYPSFPLVMYHVIVPQTSGFSVAACGVRLRPGWESRALDDLSLLVYSLSDH